MRSGVSVTTVRLAAALAALAGAGCGGDGGGPNSGNRRPVIERIVVQPPTVPRGGFAQLSALASDADDDTLHYAWTADAGTLGSTDLVRVGWTAPTTAGRYQVRVVVRDNDGADTAYANIDVGSGSLLVQSDPPGALVYVNGTLRPGQTPLLFNNLPAGGYNVELAGLYFRYVPVQVEATVVDGETALANFTLPVPGLALIDTGPVAYDEIGGFSYTEGGFGVVFSARAGGTNAVRAASLVPTHVGTNGLIIYPDATLNEPMALRQVPFTPELAFVAGNDLYIGVLRDDNIDGLMDSMDPVRRLNGVSGSAYAPAFNNSGRLLSFGLMPSTVPNNTDLMLEGDYDSVKVTRIRRVSARGGNYPSYRPDDSIVYESGGDLYHVLVDTLSPAVPVLLTDTGGFARAPAVSPDGNYIAYIDSRGPLRIYIPAIDVTTTLVSEVRTPQIAWSPNGRELLIAHNPPGGPATLHLVIELPFP